MNLQLIVAKAQAISDELATMEFERGREDKVMEVADAVSRLADVVSALAAEVRRG